jgi:hypothetical protein
VYDVWLMSSQHVSKMVVAFREQAQGKYLHNLAAFQNLADSKTQEVRQ